MAEKEHWVHLLAYNLIRGLMADSVRYADVVPHQLSFKHTVQLWEGWRSQARLSGAQAQLSPEPSSDDPSRSPFYPCLVPKHANSYDSTAIRVARAARV